MGHRPPGANQIRFSRSRLTGFAVVGLLLALAITAAAVPWIVPDREEEARRIAALGIFVTSYLALAIGKIPGLLIDRAGVALVGACLMVATGAIPLEEAYRAVDLNTITLLLGMMIVVANLRLSGFFALATAWLAGRARRPLILLTFIVLASGVFSAFLVNDAICLVMAPLVLELTIGLGRKPLPYLLGVALASNIGSTATITGNPQNMLIGSFSGLPYAAFATALAPVALSGLLLTIVLVALLHRAEFRAAPLQPHLPRVRSNPVLVVRSLLATLAVIALFFAGQPPAKAAIVVGALLLLTRRVKSARIYAEIDWSLLLMFTGLFIIVAGAERVLLTPQVIDSVGQMHLSSPPVLSALTAMLSNLVSNVPAVLLLKPFIGALPDPDNGWLLVAMASTLAGNFTLLGSIANLIVAEKAARRGVVIGFWAHFRVGAPLTVLTLILGTVWLMGK